MIQTQWFRLTYKDLNQTQWFHLTYKDLNFSIIQTNKVIDTGSLSRKSTNLRLSGKN